MGLDYIRESRGKPYIKQWAKGLSNLNTVDLFDPVFNHRRAFVSAVLLSGVDVRMGDTFCVDRQGEEALIFDGNRRVAKVVNPSIDLMAWLDAHDGNGLATVEHVSIFGDMVELSLR